MTDINVKIKTTNSPEVKTVTVKSDSKVEDIMKEIEKYSNIPPNDQKLIFKGKILKAEDPISNHKIENGVTIIMVKKGKIETQKTETQKTETQKTENQKTENQNPQPVQPSVSQPTNNVSSNPEDKITIKVKTNLDATIHNVSINKSSTVSGLKSEIEKVTNVPASQQKLIVKGKTMNDSDALSTYNLENDSTVAMLKTDEENDPNLEGMGGVNPGQLGPMMSNPDIQQILGNPLMMEQILNSPEMRTILESNPQLREALQNPQSRQLILQRILQMGSEGASHGGENPFSGRSDDLNQFDLSVSNTPNTKLGECFSKWMDDDKNGRTATQVQFHPEERQQRPQPVFQQFPQPDPNVDYKEKYKEQIAQIKDMGVDDEEKIIEALKACDGNVQYALNRLFG